MTHGYRIRPRDAATEQIECYILKNNLEAHDRLPSERDMCAMWGFNRTTLHNAIRWLTEEGVLYSRMGSGTFVAPKKLIRNLQDANGFSSAARSAGREVGTRLVSFCVREANKQVAQKMHLTLGHRVMELVRVRLLEEVPVLLETAYLDAERCRGLETYDFSDTSLYKILEEHYGIRIARGVEKVSITYTDEEEAELLAMPEGAPVFYQVGVVRDEGDAPVEYFKSIARSKYIRFASELIR